MMRVFSRFRWIGLLLLIAAATSALAAGGSFSLTPAKQEISLAPGGSIIKTLTLVNNLGAAAEFNLSFKDLGASSAPATGVELMAPGSSPYSLGRYLTLPFTHVSLAAGERRDIPIAINLPAEAPPGGFYGAVTAAVSSGGAGQTKVTAQLSSLWFIKVTGPVKASGQLLNFGPLGSWFTQQLHFQFSFKNDGNTYLNPYGGIELKPIFAWGRWRAVIVPPNFVLPASTRIREVTAPAAGFCGLYQATLKLNRGYDNVIDQQSAWVWGCQPSLALGLSLAVILFGLMVWLVVKLRRAKAVKYE